MKAARKAWFGLTQRVEARLLLGFMGLPLAIGGLAALADEVREGGTLGIDRLLLLAFRVPGQLDRAIGPRWMQESARDVTALGGFTVLTLVTVGATAMLLIHHRRRQALVFAAAVLSAQALSLGLKLWVDRPRPTLVEHLDQVYSSSFPSGHATMTPVVYLTLAGILATLERGRSEKVLVMGTAALLTVAVGVSRVYLGVHWPTDVLAGWMLGGVVALSARLALSAWSPGRGS